MRFVERKDLEKDTGLELTALQRAADQLRQSKTLDVDKHWKVERQRPLLKDILEVLKKMAGERERCMYCLDSHGTDIEHFRPKKANPDCMYTWTNYLLCCTSCGRIKGNRFPVSDGQVLLIDPTIEEPWLYLDLSPSTGKIVARFELDKNQLSARGKATVETLQLNKREALDKGHLKTLRRITELVNSFLEQQADQLTSAFIPRLLDEDDYDLLGWCVYSSGKNVEPFKSLHDTYPKVWQELETAIRPG